MFESYANIGVASRAVHSPSRCRLTTTRAIAALYSSESRRFNSGLQVRKAACPECGVFQIRRTLW